MKRFFAILITLTLLLTAIPLTMSASADSNTVTVTADGAQYTAHIGDTIHYTFYLDVGGIDLGADAIAGKITEIEGTVTYDGAALKLLTGMEPDEDDGHLPALPKLISGSVIASADTDHTLTYNAANLKGYAFSKKKALLSLDFEIIGSGDLTISNHLENLGSGEVKLIYIGDVLIAPHTSSEIAVDCPHTPPTEKPTDPPTEAPTQAPTQPATQKPTQAPTEAPSQAPTLPPAEAPTETPVRTYTDDATGVTVTAKVDAQLVVREVPLGEPDYVVSDAELNKMYDIRFMKGNTEVSLTEPMTVTFPAPRKTTCLWSVSPDLTLNKEAAEITKEYDVSEGIYHFYLTAAANPGRFIVTTSKNDLVLYGIGDVDLDGEIMILDTTAIQRWLVGIVEFTPTQILLGDFDGDGETTILDATAIQRMLVGLDYISYR